MPREFNSGGAAEQMMTLAQLEYFFLNPDAELPAAQTFRETMNPISIVNDMIDPETFRTMQIDYLQVVFVLVSLVQEYYLRLVNLQQT